MIQIGKMVFAQSEISPVSTTGPCLWKSQMSPRGRLTETLLTTYP